ncbi:hypothetical protein I4U23_020888 [Adineta vaga]|nr:hypothetical protein I4U23_020888 [Adineta vaga]
MAMKTKAPTTLKAVNNRKEEKKVLLPEMVKTSIQNTKKEFPSSKPVIQNNAEFNRLITGDFSQVFSKQRSRLFRIFLSSTFSDFKVERNELYRRVFPTIKQRCAQLGYEFQVVDMRWGVSDTADTDHTADIMCMNEIERCIDLSAGLNFIYLIGNRYGYMYVPLEIDQDEFENILTVAREEKIENSNLIQKWFLLDQNSLPSKYVYVPITTYYKHFEEQSAEQQQEKKQWQTEEKSLLKALREAADKAHEKKKISYAQANKYFESITEREIRRGTMESNSSNVIGVVRDFLNPIVETPADAKFIDSAKNERISNAINQLKMHSSKVTPPAQFKRFLVPWKPGGLNLSKEQSHQQYIDEFCQFLSTTILQMIENTCKKLSNKTFSPFHEDLLHHGLFCQEKNQFFFGREELLSNVHARIETNRRNVSSPLAFIAESGCGKTSFMARLAQDLRVWYPTSAVFIRFLGTSAQSTNIELVIRSLCRQLKLVYGTDSDDDNEDEDDQSLTFASLVRIFHERLKLLSRKRLKILRKKSIPKPLFILLDAIDQFENTSKFSFQFDSWLLRYLPRDVHIFISFIPTIERFNIKDLFLQFIRNDESTLFTIPSLRSIDCENIIRSSLQAHHRQLSSEQYKYLLTTVEHNSKPLYLKLLIDIARTWTSFQDQSLQVTLSLPETIENAVEQLFSRLENRHGKEFIQYSLAYLVYGLNGISENELEDCLSINDIVLNEIYAYHDPPIPNAVHIPSLLCQSLLYSIKEYLSQKRIHDKHILSFYHRKFSEATTKRYEHLRKQCHEHLIEIYGNDQTTYKRTITLKKRNNMIINDADRLISSQMTNQLNTRKLIALPYHCLEFGFEKDHLLRTMCLFNLNFLSCQLKSLGHTIFVDSIRHCLRMRPNWTDLRCLYHAIWSIDGDMIENMDVALIISEQILGFIDDKKTSQFYKKTNELNISQDLEKLLVECRKYCSEHDDCFRSLYAGFPQETDALAWSFSPVTHILYHNEFYCLVILDGTDKVNGKDPSSLIQTYTVAVINLQTGKVDKIYLDETFDKIWNGYITKNGNKVYLFGAKDMKIFNSRTGDMLSERSLSFDNKTFCNKAYCFTSNEEQLILANEWRLIALDQTDEDLTIRSGRIPVKNVSFEIKNTAYIDVSLRCIGANDEYVLCLIFDECNQALITLWSLNEHVEMLLMRFAFLYLETTSSYLFDFPLNNNEILYLATIDGYICTFDLIKIKSNTKVQTFTKNDTLISQMYILPDEELDRLVCLANDQIAISTKTYIALFDRKNLSTILQKISINKSRNDWNMIIQDDDHQHVLITIDSTYQFITIYRQDQTSNLNQMKINFRSNVQDLKLIQTTTMLNNDEKKKVYVLILLDDETIQLLEINQLSQASLQPNGLFTKIQNYNIGEKLIVTREYDSPYPLVMCPSNKSFHTVQSLESLNKLNIEFIALLDNDQYYIILTSDKLVYSYSVHNLNELLFEYDLKTKSTLKCFSLKTYHSNLIIFMFMDVFIVLQLKYDNIETKFHVQSEQILSIPNRNVEYSLKFIPNKKFLILEQSLNLTSNESLSDLRVFTCNEQMKISPINESITYMKSKISKSGKIIAFMTYIPAFTGSELWIAYEGNILHARLPSTLAELDVRSDFHSWMRHSLALYNQTAEKYSLSIDVTSLAIQSPNDSCLASGADDGSIILWFFTNNPTYEVLESIHNEEITGLQFDPNTKRLFSSSLDRTLAIWSPTTLLHVLHTHVPINRIHLFVSSNVLLAQGRFWGFDRLMMFYIDNNIRPTQTISKTTLNKESKSTTIMEASEVASWAL